MSESLTTRTALTPFQKVARGLGVVIGAGAALYLTHLIGATKAESLLGQVEVVVDTVIATAFLAFIGYAGAAALTGRRRDEPTPHLD